MHLGKPHQNLRNSRRTDNVMFTRFASSENTSFQHFQSHKIPSCESEPLSAEEVRLWLKLSEQTANYQYISIFSHNFQRIHCLAPVITLTPD